jgi:hypothetical protein
MLMELTKSRNVLTLVNQLNVSLLLTAHQVIQTLAKHLKSVMLPMIEIQPVNQSIVEDMHSVANKKFASKTNVKQLSADPTLTVNHLISMANTTSVMLSWTNVSKLIVSDMKPVANTKDAKLINAVPLNVPIIHIAHQISLLMFSKNVEKMKANVSISNVLVMPPVTVSNLPKLVMTVLMENVNATWINASSTSAEPENTVSN